MNYTILKKSEQTQKYVDFVAEEADKHRDALGFFAKSVYKQFSDKNNLWILLVCREAVLRINLQYENRENCNRGFTPTVRNVHLKNVTCEKSKLGVLIIGLDDDDHVYNISVEDSHFNNVAKDGNDIKGAKDVTFKNLYINGKLVK